MFEPLFLIDLALALAAAATAILAGRHAGRLPYDATRARPMRRALYLTAGLVAARLVVAALLTTGGWDLAAGRLTLGLPAAIVPLAWALTTGRGAAATGRTTGAAVATHTATAGTLISAYLQFSPPGPQDTAVTAAVTIALLGAAAGVSGLLTRWRGRTGLQGPPAAARLPWFAVSGTLTALALSWAGYALNPVPTHPNAEHAHHAAGPLDWGGGPVVDHHHAGHRQLAVSELTGPRDAPADVKVTLTAAHTTVRLDSGRTVTALTFNGQAPGPQIRIRQGQLLEVTLINEDVTEGVTVHWHGVDVPNAEDGVPGVTQAAVMPGGSHVYRFVPDRAGTFWYHTHRQSADTVARGLFGALIVDPADHRPAVRFEETVFVHQWPDADDPITAFDRADTPRTRAVDAGQPGYLRLINSSEEPQRLTTHGLRYTVATIDGNPVNEPTELPAQTDLLLPAGGRIDLAFTMPGHAVTVRIDAGEEPNDAALVLDPAGGAEPAAPGRGTLFDPATYGAPAPTTPSPAAEPFDRDFTVVLEDGFGYRDGALTFGTLMNGRLAPAVPTLMVAQGDRVRTRIVNRSIMDHPMHLHGHRILVLARNGVTTTGSPWWTDTLNLSPGEIYDVAFTADNPGIWMNHCHNFSHAAGGMIMHLAYAGVDSSTSTTARQHDHHNHRES